MTARRSVFRRTFVGREPQLRQLEAAFATATAGEGSLALVVGEPGIGKTALGEQLAAYVVAQGGLPLVGRCYEPGASGALPYLPFVEALRGYLLTQEVERLRAELSNDAPEIARLLPEIRERLEVEPPPPGADPESERWRLLQAACNAIARIAAATTPGGLLLIIEDLHWADRGTLDLLGHLGGALTAARVLLVGTYRDLEVDRTHPLSASLAELRRHGEISRIQLQGLTQEEVGRLLAAYANMDLSPALAETVHRRTEGNPLFVQEIARDLMEGLRVLDGGATPRPFGERSAEAGVPGGLRDVIGKRLANLSPDCVRLLAVAAVVGRGFALETLRQAADLDEGQLIANLEEATRVGILEETTLLGSVQYHFAHALFHQYLYEELSAPRRARVHQKVAEVLERQYGDRLDEHAAELSEHFAHSGRAGDLAKATGYAELAAQQAMGVFAYSEAVHLLERALALQRAYDPNDAARCCDLLLTLGRALLPAGQPKRVFEEVAEEAFGLAEKLGDHDRASVACELAVESLNRFGGNSSFGTPVYRQWAHQADRHAVPGTQSRLHADRALIGVYSADGQNAAANAVIDNMLSLARSLGDNRTIFLAALSRLRPTFPPGDELVQLQVVEEFATRSRAGVDARVVIQLLRRAHLVYFVAGNRTRADAVIAEWTELAAASRDAEALLWPVDVEALRALIDGDLEGVVSLGERISTIGRGTGVATRGAELREFLVWQPLVYLGRPLEAFVDNSTGTLTELWGRMTPLRLVQLAVCRAHAGSSTQTWAEIEGLLHGPFKEPVVAAILRLLLEIAVLAKARDGVARLMERLCDLRATRDLNIVYNVGRLLGAGATLLGDIPAARAHYLRGLEWASSINYRPEVALTRLEMAELAAGHPPSLREFWMDETEALANLDALVDDLRLMRMGPALARALALRERWSALPHRPPRSNVAGRLTERELQILRLVAAGRSSRQISEELVLSVRTVDRHIGNIYSKLDVRTRAQATGYAHTHGLLSAE